MKLVHPAPEGATAAGKPKFTSGFALLDVTEGRQALHKRLRAGEKVRVMIVAYMDDPLAVGHDDGVSREFSLNIEQVREINETDRL